MSQHIRQFVLILIISLCIVPLTSMAFAQFETAVVLGAVRDPNGAVMPAANVTLKNTATGVTSSTQTDSNGDYQFLNVRIGVYQVSAESQGFSKAVVDNIQVVVN